MKTIRPKQYLGQNFLRDENIARKIVSSMEIQRSNVVLEIGPGEAALTKYLVQQTDTLTVVDIDHRVVARMRELFPGNAINVVHQDFLTTDFSAILHGHATARLRIIGNIPYNITSPILFHILDNRSHVSDATLMMQKEVARRLVAQPRTKDYGILAVFCQIFTDVSLLFDVSPKCFFPSPKVTSSVIRMKILPQPRYALHDEAFFRSMVRAVFGKRRKTLRNSLSYFLDPLPSIPERFDLSRRPEDLSLRELAELGNILATKRA